MTKPKAYLAGPDVFLPDPDAMFATKKGICTAAGLDGVSPLDQQVDADGRGRLQHGLAIARANEATMDGCDLIIANMTPFRGPSMDVGTAYEIGYMRGQGKPVFGYTNDGRGYVERVRAFVEETKAAGEPPVHLRAGTDSLEDNRHLLVENHDLRDNLMLEGAVQATPSVVFPPRRPIAEPLAAPGAFDSAVAAARNVMAGRAETMTDDSQRQQMLDEWTACRQAVAGFDKTLVDLRRFGFTLVTILLSANGFLFAQSTIGEVAKIGIFIALLVLIAGLFRQDRTQEVFVRGAVLRALAIERRLGASLTYQIAYWSERGRTGTWGHLLYLSFCLADLVLVAGGLIDSKVVTWNALLAAACDRWWQLGVCTIVWAMAS